MVFKANGHLGLLRSKPNAENRCAGQSAGIPGRDDPDDPYYQDYLAIPNWSAITAAGIMTFTLASLSCAPLFMGKALVNAPCIPGRVGDAVDRHVRNFHQPEYQSLSQGELIGPNGGYGCLQI